MFIYATGLVMQTEKAFGLSGSLFVAVISFVTVYLVRLSFHMMLTIVTISRIVAIAEKIPSLQLSRSLRIELHIIAGIVKIAGHTRSLRSFDRCDRSAMIFIRSLKSL